MKNKVLIICIIVIILIIVGIIIINKNKISDKLDGVEGDDAKGVKLASDAVISSFNYSFSATYIGGIYTYTVNNKDNDVTLEIEYLGINDDNPEIIKLDKSVLDDLMNIIKKYKINEWDGYHKYATDVLDGSGFSLNIKFTDKTTIYVSGSNCGPEGYGHALRDIEELLKPYANEFLEKNDLN